MNNNNHKFEKYFTGKSPSRWADPNEIKNAPGIMKIDVTDVECEGCGLPIISDGQSAYVDNSDTHTIVFGATGSKKTRLFAMPMINLFALAGESFIATDPKGELYAKTSGLVAKKGYNTIVLNFRNLEESSLWNPLALIYETYHSGKTDESVLMMNDFITTICNHEKVGTKDPFWSQMASSLALALMLTFIETSKESTANIYSFAKFFVENATPEATKNYSNCVADGSIASINFKSILTSEESEKTFSSVCSTLSAAIRPFIMQKKLCQVLSKSSFNMRDIGKEKTALYIIIPDEKTTFHYLITIFIKQVYETLILVAQSEKNSKLPVRVNFLLDEFGNIPAIPDMDSMITAARSRNIRFFLLAQCMHQLRHKYRENAETIKGNCSNWVFLTSRELDLLEEFSKLSGETAYSNSFGISQLRPLISVSDLQRLNKEKGEALIFHNREYPFVAKLPDIDDYVFKTYPLVERKKGCLPKINLYNGREVMREIKNGKRHIPFSEEVFGEKKYLRICYNAIIQRDVSKVNEESQTFRDQVENFFNNITSLDETEEDLKARITREAETNEDFIEELIDEVTKYCTLLQLCKEFVSNDTKESEFVGSTSTK